MTNHFSDLLDSFMYYMETRAERDKACGDCESSWGYFGYEYEKKLEKAGDELEAAFKRYLEGYKGD